MHRQLFDRLLVQPLTHCFDGGRTSDRLLLVVDGLDEAVANQGADDPHTILGLLHRHGPLLPPWVGLLVTSRPEQPASTALTVSPCCGSTPIPPTTVPISACMHEA